jgi:hypothetical protein
MASLDGLPALEGLPKVWRELVPSDGLARRPNPAVREALATLDPAGLAGGKGREAREAARGCLAGLWLAQGYLDESHAISQELAGRAGSYWHGIMHRREGDFSNAKYWFRQAGPPEWGPALAAWIAGDTGAPEAMRQAGRGGEFSPAALVDACQSRAAGVERVEWAEFRFALDAEVRRAIGAKEPGR